MANLRHDGRSQLTEIAALVHQYTQTRSGSSPYFTAIEGVSILRSDPLSQPSLCIIKPALCITLQGEKRAHLGDKLYQCGAGLGLVVTVEMPSRGTVCAVSKRKPYLGIELELNLETLQKLVEESPLDAGASSKPKGVAAFTLHLNEELIDCALRSVRLLFTPEAILTLYPGIMHEICYWLLRSPGGEQLRRVLMMANGQDRRVMQAIRRVRERFREPLHVEELAHAVNMSPTTFHRQFKMVTSMAPLQYQKQLRLLEARRLMISDDASVEGAALEVGYASVSQFSREYTRTFGSPPRREVSVWKAPHPHRSGRQA